MASQSRNQKSFLYRNSNIVDFLSAGVIISICLIVLVPKVHESFLPQEHDDLGITQIISSITNLEQDPDPSGDDEQAAAAIASSSAPQAPTETTLSPPVNPHGHHHSHNFPVGEVLICAGFFVFYCIGLGLSKSSAPRPRRSIILTERKISTVCCSSTRCPSSQPENTGLLVGGQSLGLKTASDVDGEADTLIADKIELNDDCVMLLYRHHTHHTHSRHHEHVSGSSSQPHNQPVASKRSDYGSVRVNKTSEGEPDLARDCGNDPGYQTGADSQPTTIHVEEIRIRSSPIDDNASYSRRRGADGWPLATKVFLFSLIFAGILILFDMNVLGLIKAIKVFRAASTGALLYVSFFIILPRGSAGCNSCQKEDVC